MGEVASQSGITPLLLTLSLLNNYCLTPSDYSYLLENSPFLATVDNLLPGY